MSEPQSTQPFTLSHGPGESVPRTKGYSDRLTSLATSILQKDPLSPGKMLATVVCDRSDRDFSGNEAARKILRSIGFFMGSADKTREWYVNSEYSPSDVEKGIKQVQDRLGIKAIPLSEKATRPYQQLWHLSGHEGSLPQYLLVAAVKPPGESSHQVGSLVTFGDTLMVHTAKRDPITLKEQPREPLIPVILDLSKAPVASESDLARYQAEAARFHKHPLISHFSKLTASSTGEAAMVPNQPLKSHFSALTVSTADDAVMSQNPPLVSHFSDLTVSTADDEMDTEEHNEKKKAPSRSRLAQSYYGLNNASELLKALEGSYLEMAAELSGSETDAVRTAMQASREEDPTYAEEIKRTLGKLEGLEPFYD